MQPGLASPPQSVPVTAAAKGFALTPAECVALAWGAFLAIALHVRHVPYLGTGLPRGDIIVVALSVLAVKLAAAYVRTPWPRPSSRLAVVFTATATLAIVPTAAIIFDELGRLPDRVPTSFSDGGVVVTYLLVFRLVILRLAVGLAPLAAWFAVGLHLKRHDGPRVAALPADLRSALEYARALAPPLLLILSYPVVGDLMARPWFPDRDGLMQAIDRALCLGHDPSHALEAAISAPLSELMALSYTWYTALWPLVFGAAVAVGTRRALREASFAITAALALGYLGYLLMPVRGPMAAETFHVPLDFYWFKDVKQELMDRYRVARDCFPSLHTAISLLSLWTLWRNARRVFWVALPLAALIPFACVYLRYHYVTDVLAGALLALGIAWATRRLSVRAGL